MRRRALISTVLCCMLAAPVGAGEPPRELHGMADAFSASGVTLAWAVLRGTDEASTAVVLRIATDAPAYRSVSVSGSDPFTKQARTVLKPTALTRTIELRVPRPHFADFPRTDLRFYASESVAATDQPSLVVYYLGIPDTTPEFAGAGELDAYLTDRLARARANPGTKPP